MENSSDGFTKEHFHFGHLGLIALCAAFLIFFTVLKSGFNMSLNPQAQAENTTPVVMFEQAKQDVVAQSPEVNPQAGSNDQLAENLAVLDPVTFGGSVLGTSTVSGLFPAADQMLTPDMLSQIKIQTENQSDADSIKQYSDQMAFVEAHYNTLGILSDLNSQDAATLKNVDSQSKAVVAELGKIVVPKELEEYHKIKMMYYTTLGYMAQSFNGERKDMDMSSLTSILFSLTEKMDATQNQILAKYQIQL